MTENVVVGESLRGASLLAGVQFVSRLFTFILNVWLTAYLNDASAVGIASVQLYLFYTVTLTLAREGLRRTCLRIVPEKSCSGVINMCWITVLFGISVIVPATLAIFLRDENDAVLGSVTRHDYERSLYVTALATAVELISEPFFIAGQGRLLYALRSKIEAVAVVNKCLATVACVWFLDLKVTAFAVGHLVYSSTLLTMYGNWAFQYDEHLEAPGLWNFKSWRDMMPSNRLKIEDWTLPRVALSMSAQTVFKLVLAEGEKMVMMIIGLHSNDQAVYAIVFNLGSLVARFVFQPVEESAFAIFGKLNSMNSLSESHNLLRILCKWMSIIGLVFVAFGPHFSHFLLRILYGIKWSDGTEAPVALGMYCYYVLILGINGITEAFVHATGDDAVLRHFNLWLCFFSIVYLASAAVLLQFRIQGLIVANCINMVVRIVYNMFYISKHVPAFKSLFPHFKTVAAFLCVHVAMAISERFLYLHFKTNFNALMHLGAGLVSFALIVLVLFIFENDQIRDSKALYTSMKSLKVE